MQGKLLKFVAAAFLVAAPAIGQPGTSLQVQPGGIAAAGAAFPVSPSQPDWMAAHFIDVGQGSAALLEFSCGLVLVDTGGQSSPTIDGRARFAQYLDAVFARRTDLNHTIDVVFISHPHRDHTNGISLLTSGSSYRIRHVIVDNESEGSGISQQRSLIRFANQRRIPVAPIRTGMLDRRLGLTSSYIDPLRCRGRDPDLRVVWGSYDERSRWSDAEERMDENNHSVATRIVFGESSFLFVGDMEEVAQHSMLEFYRTAPRLLDTDVYVAGHHGSRNGTTAELVRAMSPELAIISAGDPADEEPNFSAFQFGHPNRAAIRLLSDQSHGVSFSRPGRRVAVGVSGGNPRRNVRPVYEHQEMDRAIFSTGWDGNIVVVAHRNGEKRIIVD